MESFLSELKKILESNTLDLIALKETSKNLNDQLQIEQIQSNKNEEEFLKNSLIFDLSAQKNEELDIKLEYYQKESENLQNHVKNLSESLENVKESIKIKEETQTVLSKEIVNYNEIISQISNNNKIMEDNFNMKLVPIDIKFMGLNLNKKPRLVQTSSFLDFISEKKKLQTKQLKLKMKFSDIHLKKKLELLKLSNKISNLKFSPNFPQKMIVAENEKMIRILQSELEEKKYISTKDDSTNFLDIKASQEKALSIQFSKINQNSILNEKKLKYMDFKISRMNSESPILSNFFSIFKEKIMFLKEKDIEFNNEELKNKRLKHEEISFDIKDIKLCIHKTNENYQNFERIYREEIKELNSLKFELCLYHQQAPPTHNNIIYDPFSLNKFEEVHEKKNILYFLEKARTIADIDDSNEVFRRKSLKGKKYDYKTLRNKKQMKITDFEHYRIHSKLNSLKEDHLLFSNFIDYRLNPAKYQNFNCDSPRKIINNIENNQLINQSLSDINENNVNTKLNTQISYENSQNNTPSINIDSVFKRKTMKEGTWENFSLNKLEDHAEVEKILKEEVVATLTC